MRALLTVAVCLLALTTRSGDGRAAAPAPVDCCNLTVNGDAELRPRADQVTVVFVVALQGRRSSPTTIKATPSWGADEQILPVPALGVGARTSPPIKFVFPAHPGTLGPRETVTGVVAAQDGDDRSDNTVEIQIPAGTRPTADFAITPAAPQPRPTAEAVVVRLRVTNNGTATATPTVRVAAPWGATKSAPPQNPLAPGASRPTRVRLSVPGANAGENAVLVARVEPADGERADSHNHTTLTVRIPTAGGRRPVLPQVVVDVRPDLEVSILPIDRQSDPTEITVRVRVRNVGDAKTPGTMLFVGKPLHGQGTVRPLDPGEPIDVPLTMSVPEQLQGRKANIRVTARTVAGEADLANNNDSTPVALLDGDARSSIAPIVMVLAVVLVIMLIALAVLARSWLAQRVRGPRPVRTGFAELDDPDGELAPDAVLTAGRRYLFWVEIGDGAPPDAPESTAATLEVALFALGGGAKVPVGADRGVMTIAERGGALVARQPGDDAPPRDDGPDAARRLLFDVRSGETTAVLRCSIYTGNVLLWSQLIRAPVGQPGRRSASVDVAIIPSLDPDRLRRLPPHRLSVLLNSDGAGTHALTFLGAKNFKAEATFDAAELQDALDSLRGGLRLASWGNDDEWSPGHAYRYATADPARSRLDLARLAIRGYRIYTQFVTRFASEIDAYELQDLMREPGLVQIATKQSPRHLLPAALLYDHPLDATKPRLEDYTLCPAFSAACAGDEPLAATACFRGDCPSHGELHTVCPSGFWGYRHELGMPLSGRGADDTPTEITYSAAPELLIAVTTDPNLDLRESHEDALRRLSHGDRWRRAATRDDTVEQLRTPGLHVVYFYCHGGAANNVPFLQVGAPGEPPLTSDLLFTRRIQWDQPRPLVFLNGCRTTAVQPRVALEFVSFWLHTANAAGVVGSDITVFEPLASSFGEHCLGLFLGGHPLGAAVRAARLALLKQHNPLGLTYVPFALAGLQLTDGSAPLAAGRADAQPAIL